jgi:hypothetical protein
MTLREFENGYWYLDDLRDFARQIGIPETTKLRKDEIERAVVARRRSRRGRRFSRRSNKSNV